VVAALDRIYRQLDVLEALSAKKAPPTARPGATAS
jgi:hypothetical protein